MNRIGTSIIIGLAGLCTIVLLTAGQHPKARERDQVERGNAYLRTVPAVKNRVPDLVPPGGMLVLE